MTAQLQAILSELHLRLAQVYGARLEKLVLYGSRARGDAEPDSDIDVLVVLKGGKERSPDEKRRTSELRAEICLRNSVVISLMYVSVDDYHHDDEPLLMNARREGIEI